MTAKLKGIATLSSNDVPVKLPSEFRLINQVLQHYKATATPSAHERFAGVPFWIWNYNLHYKTHNDSITDGKPRCCFNHIIGLPEKAGRPYPLFDYQRILFEATEQHRYLWIKKATGLGASEFYLRYVAWRALKDDAWRGRQVCIVTGPNIALATVLIDRLRRIVYGNDSLNGANDGNKTSMMLNHCKIEAFPSHHLDAMRSLKAPVFIFIDEADFFPVGQQQNVRDVSERYIAKSDPHIVLCSTPNLPGGLLEKIELEENSIYHKIFLHYTAGAPELKAGVGSWDDVLRRIVDHEIPLEKAAEMFVVPSRRPTIYTLADLVAAFKSPSFPREYGLAYAYGLGNVFLPSQIERAVAIEYDPAKWIVSSPKSLGVDPAFGSSKFAFVVTAQEDGLIKVLHAREFERPDFNDMVMHAWSLRKQYNISKVYVDAANPAFIKSLKGAIGERLDYENIQDQLWDWQRVVPIAFSQYNEEMLTHTQKIVSDGILAVAPAAFADLVKQMRSASEKNRKLDKSHNSLDLIDALQLSLRHYRIV